MTPNVKGRNAPWAGPRAASDFNSVPLYNVKKQKATNRSGVLGFPPTSTFSKTGSTLFFFGHRVRMPTATRVLFVGKSCPLVLNRR